MQIELQVDAPTLKALCDARNGMMTAVLSVCKDGTHINFPFECAAVHFVTGVSRIISVTQRVA